MTMSKVAIHKPGDQMYLIHDPDRNGLLTWEFEEDRYLMAFTTGDKAEEYNSVVLKERPGEIVVVTKGESKKLARNMVSSGVRWMLIDYPVINDQDFWDVHPYEIGGVPREVGRDYSVVDLKAIVARL